MCEDADCMGVRRLGYDDAFLMSQDGLADPIDKKTHAELLKCKHPVTLGTRLELSSLLIWA